MDRGRMTLITSKPSLEFVETPYISKISEKALSYSSCGFPVHLSGPTGVGKTTLAMHVAARIGRPVVLICGDHEFGTSDLVGYVSGYRHNYTKDNFIRSVVKTEDVMTSQWFDNRLTVACERGLTLVYDEFTRSRPEANNVLLSVLESKILPVSGRNGKESYVRVHPDFRAIFTSNPEEYAGVYKSQDALKDRLVTLELNSFDEETEMAIVRGRVELCENEIIRIVKLIRVIRNSYSDKLTPTVRSSIKIAKYMDFLDKKNEISEDKFIEVCNDTILPIIAAKKRSSVSRLIIDAANSVGREFYGNVENY